ncbi:MAG TPA: NAD(P)-binding domain-containing protein, partial [Candidatus Nanopelagicales bacterium]|nr:NAD(P)-binding domain-containing protein [Candidatus Nanopelagicales bacterium]
MEQGEQGAQSDQSAQSDEARLRGRKIGFLGGGNMAEALIRGLLHSSTVEPHQIRASDLKSERLGELHTRYGIETTTDNEILSR